MGPLLVDPAFTGSWSGEGFCRSPTPEATPQVLGTIRVKDAERDVAGDMTHWSLADGTGVEILDFVDDYSRMVTVAVVLPVTTAADVVADVYQGAERFGFPVSMLTDNGCIFTLRHGTKMHHIWVGPAHIGRRIIILVADLDIRVLSEEGELLRHLTLDTTKDYQPIGKGPEI